MDPAGAGSASRVGAEAAGVGCEAKRDGPLPGAASLLELALLRLEAAGTGGWVRCRRSESPCKCSVAVSEHLQSLSSFSSCATMKKGAIKSQDNPKTCMKSCCRSRDGSVLACDQHSCREIQHAFSQSKRDMPAVIACASTRVCRCS